MAYPVLALHKESKRIVRDGRDEQQSVGGATYIRRFYASDKYDFELRHPSLSVADMTTLTDFYAANMASTFDFAWPEDGVTYTGMRFGRGGISTRWVSPTRRDAFVRLVAA